MSRGRTILVMGLPGAGKSTFAARLAERLAAVHWNADRVRNGLWPELGFAPGARLTQARRMRHLCDTVTEAGCDAVADFVCPTPETREAFGRPDILVWADRTPVRDFPDTTALFVPPTEHQYRVGDETDISALAGTIAGLLAGGR